MILTQADTGNQLDTPTKKQHAGQKLQEKIKDGDKKKIPPGLPHIVKFGSEELAICTEAACLQRRAGSADEVNSRRARGKVCAM